MTVTQVTGTGGDPAAGPRRRPVHGAGGADGLQLTRLLGPLGGGPAVTAVPYSNSESGPASTRTPGCNKFCEMASDLCAATVENMEQEELEERKKKNKLLIQDLAWSIFHMLMGLIDISFIWQKLTNFSFQGLMSLTVSTSVWCSLLSCFYNAASFRAILLVEPFPLRYSLRTQTRRDDIYRQSARFFAETITFSGFSVLLHFMLSWVDPQSRSESHDISTEIKVLVSSWLCLVFQRPRHWMCAPNRFLIREARLFELKVGQSGIHRQVSYFALMLVLFHFAFRKWSLPVLNVYVSSETGVMFITQLVALYFTLQFLGWTAWRVAFLAAQRLGSPAS